MVARAVVPQEDDRLDPTYPATPPVPPLPPAGWCPDPFHGAGKRFWNGAGWTELAWG
ncbi:DUF2510 domain-containing protein [Serinicoccus chungangensis]|uniref:DUF2510 domain-containing protein n=1 Tax=Serinicoccus chungangensis TaxID=767452 RepID=UPI0009F87114